MIVLFVLKIFVDKKIEKYMNNVNKTDRKSVYIE